MTAGNRDHVFISYRRDDARGASGRLYDWLRIAFGREHVFRDVHSIGVGKWRDKIDRALARSKVCVAVIGPRWADSANLPRLHQADDLVRHELVSALACDALLLVPTLVEGAELPQAEVLPSELRPLFRDWNARPVTESGWEDDVRRLIAEIAQSASLPVGPDVDSLLHDVSVARQRVCELEQTSRLQAEQLEAQRRAIDNLTEKLAAASAADRPGLAAACSALAKGDSRAAEDAFEREFEAQNRVLESARQTMAEAARNVANLALSRDVAKAVTFYRKALAIEPEHAETLRLFGVALLLLGDLQAATAAFSDSLRVAIASGDAWGEMAAQGRLGNVRRLAGDLPGAQVAYEAALGLAERHLSRDPANTGWQHGMSLSHDRLGDMRVAQGDGAGALNAYRKGLAIAEALAGRDPANTGWQRDLSVSHGKVGNVLMAQGDGAGALDAYRKGLVIAEALIERDPANIVWQRDLSVSHIRIGDVLVAQGDGAGALDAYRKSHAILEALAERDPTNTGWQRDLSVSHQKLGDMLKAQGDSVGALEAYRKSRAIAEALAARDPANTGWQHDLSVSHYTIGAVLLARGDGAEALDAYRKSLAIAEALAERDPAHTGWQRDLSVSHEKIGDVLKAQGDSAGALEAYRKSHAIAEALAERDSANTGWQRDLSVSLEKIGDVLVAQGDGPGALDAYRKSLAIRGALAERDPTNAEWQVDVAVSCSRLGIHPDLSVRERRDLLLRGRTILEALEIAGRLHADQDRVAWFDEALEELPNE